MPDLISIIQDMTANGAFTTIARNPIAQFGTPVRRYVFSEVLPERFVRENAFRESLVRYRTRLASDSPRFSPPVKKSGLGLVGDMLVELGTQSIAVGIEGREFDNLVAEAAEGNDASVREMINAFVDLNAKRAIIEKQELQRAQALVNAQVVRTGDNGFGEPIDYPNPAGHRAAAGGDWTSDAYDPMDDIISMHQLLASKGYQTSRILTSTQVVSTLARNAKISSRTGTLQVVGGSLVAAGGFATVNSINQMLQSNGLPVIETYDAVYRDDAGASHPFLPAGTMLFVAQGGQNEQTFQFEDETRVVSNPLGYTALGRVAGQSTPGPIINVGFFGNYPPRVEIEAVSESLPVILEPEAVAVINTITTA